MNMGTLAAELAQDMGAPGGLIIWYPEQANNLMPP
jgi:hypothetical protein